MLSKALNEMKVKEQVREENLGREKGGTKAMSGNTFDAFREQQKGPHD